MPVFATSSNKYAVDLRFDYNNMNWWQYELLDDFFYILELRNGDLLREDIKEKLNFDFIFLGDFEDVNRLEGARGGGNYVLQIKKGFRCDGSSGPTIDNDCDVVACIVHDALYLAMREGILDIKFRKRADKIYRDLMFEAADDIHKDNCIARWKIKHQANLRYVALRLFGDSSAKK